MRRRPPVPVPAAFLTLGLALIVFHPYQGAWALGGGMIVGTSIGYLCAWLYLR